MAQDKHGVIIGTAGHIDHGKSSLVLALTGKDPDRLAEEKDRGITITLGFAKLELGDGIKAGVVDVPGHERFVREMIAGATGIDVALLCIAADDGIMPQTREHLSVITLLGIPQLVVALTKCDIPDAEWREAMKSEIEQYLSDTRYAYSPIVEVSSKTGLGLDELKQELKSAAKKSKRHILGNVTRQPVDRVFTIKGAGTVITGTLWSGHISVGDELEILPKGTRARVRSIQIHDTDMNEATSGNRVALNLNGVSTEDVRPGDMLAEPGKIVPTDTFDVDFTYMPIQTKQKKHQPLKSGVSVHVDHGTKEIVGRLLFMNGKKELEPGETCLTQIRCTEPLPVSWRDRFVVRSYSPAEVIGGGVVLRAHPRRKTNVRPEETDLLNALKSENTSEIAKCAFNLETLPVTVQHLIVETGLDEGDIKVTLNALKNGNKAITIGKNNNIYTTNDVLTKCTNSLESALKRFHTKHASATGIAKDSLKEMAFASAEPEIFDAILDNLVRKKACIITNGEVSHIQAGSGAKAALDSAKSLILKLLSDQGESPAFIKDIAGETHLDTKITSKALTSLEQDGKIVKVSREFYFERNVLSSLVDKVIDAIKSGKGSVAELKDAMNTSRKYAVPILEYMDRVSITKRIDDTRVLIEK